MKSRAMKVFIFKPTNEPVEKIEVKTIEEIPAAIQGFAEINKNVACFAYAEAQGKTWTIICLNPFEIKEGRIKPPTRPVENLPSAKQQDVGKGVPSTGSDSIRQYVETIGTLKRSVGEKPLPTANTRAVGMGIVFVIVGLLFGSQFLSHARSETSDSSNPVSRGRSFGGAMVLGGFTLICLMAGIHALASGLTSFGLRKQEPLETVCIEYYRLAILEGCENAKTYFSRLTLEQYASARDWFELDKRWDMACAGLTRNQRALEGEIVIREVERLDEESAFIAATVKLKSGHNLEFRNTTFRRNGYWYLASLEPTQHSLNENA